jgi:hypothetical protein
MSELTIHERAVRTLTISILLRESVENMADRIIKLMEECIADATYQDLTKAEKSK